MTTRGVAVAIIPCLNEQASIDQVVQQTRQHVDWVVVVDDGSTDDTADIARRSGAVAIVNRSPRGPGRAASAGIQYVLTMMPSVDIIITLDGDGQHDPNSIPSLLAGINNGTSVVIGSRRMTIGNTPFLRWLGNMIFRFLRNTGHKTKIQDAESGFRAYRACVLSNLKIETNHFGFCEEMAIKVRASHYKIAEVPVKSIYGNDLHKYSFKQQMRRGVEVPYTILRWRFCWSGFLG